MDVSLRKAKNGKQTKKDVERPFKRPRTSFATQIGATGSFAPEKKNVDGTPSLTSVGTAWSALSLINSIAQGAGGTQRIARKVNMVSLLVRASLTTAATGNLRWMVVYDHAPQGALPAITDILVVDSINSPQNLNNNDRFMIIHDELINSNSGGTVIHVSKFFRKFNPGLQSVWTNAATGTIADVTTGAVYVCAVGTAAVTLNAYTRIRFTDQ